jgi:hypothetical protein
LLGRADRPINGCDPGEASPLQGHQNRGFANRAVFWRSDPQREERIVKKHSQGSVMYLSCAVW